MTRHFVPLLILTSFLLIGGMSHALQDFPGAKTLDTGFDPTGTCKATTSPFTFTIHLDAENFTTAMTVKDTIPTTFTISRLVSSCGTATQGTKPKERGKITWKLSGCTTTTTQTLQVSLTTAHKPGQSSSESPLFSPRFCGPLTINEGAVLVSGRNEISELSNPLSVAACRAETTGGCVDADNDGWSVDCWDCSDTDPMIHPDMAEVCGDGIDNDCDAQVDEAC